ncbi:MAG TPA: SurA N-terminal domain-containing protein [Candidatus Paceibacterota bacterium]
MSEEIMGNQQETTRKRSGLSFFKLVVFIVIVAAIIAVGYFLMKPGVISGKSVAVVNGQKIMRLVYDERYAQLAASITFQGQSATTTEAQAEIKNQTLDNLVTETLLLQAAEKEGIKADEKAVDTMFSQNKSQFPDETAFQKALTDQGQTENTFKEFLIRDNIIRQYLLAHIDLSSAIATKEEVTTLYNQAVLNDKNIPPLDQVRSQVENQIIQIKQQQLITDFIQQLKASSTIEILLK